MPTKPVPRLFERGSGFFVMPLVKKIVELHGGHVAIASTLGAGTTVTVGFPAERTIRLPRVAANVA